MTKKNILALFVLMIITLIWALSGFINMLNSTPDINNGRMIFAETIKLGKNPTKIKIKTPQNTITLEADNNLWQVKECDYYFANIKLVNTLLSDIQNARYISQQTFEEDTYINLNLRQPTKGDEGEGVLIETFNQEEPIDAVIIGKKNSQNQFHHIRPADRQEVWIAEGEFELPLEIYSWLMQPLFDFSENIFEKITLTKDGESKTAQRQSVYTPFFHQKKPVFPQTLLERFAYLTMENVLSAQNFDETLFPQQKQITLQTFNGLLIQINLYHDTQNYWIKITLLPDILSTPSVNAYIKSNAFRYDGWFFKIPAATGKIFANFNI